MRVQHPRACFTFKAFRHEVVGHIFPTPFWSTHTSRLLRIPPKERQCPPRRRPLDHSKPFAFLRLLKASCRIAWDPVDPRAYKQKPPGAAMAQGPQASFLRGWGDAPHRARRGEGLYKRSVWVFGGFGSAAAHRTSGGSSPGPGNLGQDRPTWAQLRPSWANLGLTCPQLGPSLGPTWAHLGPPGREGRF